MTRHLFSLTALTISLTAGAVWAQDRTVTLGQVSLSFYAVVGGVVHEILEREGYTVELVEGGHSDIFPQLGTGDVDILAAAWLPGGHAALYEPVRETTFQIAPIYEDATFFWVVPDYVLEDAVSEVSDLTNPDVVARIPQTIVSLPEATGLTTGGRRMMQTYGLDNAGYELVAGDVADWFGAFQTAIEAEEWIVFPLWQPQWINIAYDVRPLRDPLNVYGDPDTAWLIGHETLRDTLDADTLAILENMRIPVEEVAEMDRLVNAEGLTARDAARRWMGQNADAVSSWDPQS